MFKKDLLALGELKKRLNNGGNNGIKSVILFGSKARGDDKRGSDMDLFVLSKNKEKAGELLYDISETIFMKHFVNFSFVIYSESKFKKYCNSGSLFLCEIKREGKTIWKKN
ncbi:MAG: nucleotidyltransferase domain-containing protein [bacterium]